MRLQTPVLVRPLDGVRLEAAALRGVAAHGPLLGFWRHVGTHAGDHPRLDAIARGVVP
ncbi:MAG: hypothetical protein OEQ47_09790 [Acidimicrobiia bacterium]|nr:hypothetical protein [Acidimicrobiia bacterium]